MKTRIRAVVLLLIVLAMLPVNVVFTGKPSWGCLSMKHVQYDPERRVFINRAGQLDNLYRILLRTDPMMAKKYGEIEVSEEMIIGTVPKATGSNTHTLKELPGEIFQAFLHLLIYEIQKLQVEARHWLLRQILVPPRLADFYTRCQVTRAP